MGSSSLRLLAPIVAISVTTSASAQFEDKTCISFDTFSQILVRKAALQLGFKEAVSHVVEDQFIADLQAKQWDLIGLELAFAKIQKKTEILDLFKQQHAGGAKFIVSYAHLDEWPELQEFMGVEKAVDQPFFLDIAPPPPGNPIWFGNEDGLEWSSPVLWSDNGDYLTPAPGTTIVTLFENGQVAAVMTDDRTRLVNGWNFDEYGGGAPTSAVRDMIVFLFGCGADFARNGQLNLDDFFFFQSLFVQGRGPANYDFDDALTVFDFLAFFNDFVAGCPH